MKTLNNTQILKIIDNLYDPKKHTAANHALVNVFFNGWTIYKAELHGDLAKNTLVKRVKRVNDEVEFIQSLYD